MDEKKISHTPVKSFWLAFLLLSLVACEGRIDNVNNNVKSIPAGYIGRVLTPKGWNKDIHEAGQVDLGMVNNEGQGNVLVLVEATSKAIKEQFLEHDPRNEDDKADHRVMTKKKIPLDMDCYVRVVVPDDYEARNRIFALVTPQTTKDPRVRIITLQNIYDQFATMDVRGSIREIVADYDDDTAILHDLRNVNGKIAQAAIDVVKRNRVPLLVQNSQISNMKADDAIWQAEIKKASADAEAAGIEKVGNALRMNPAYVDYMKWKTLDRKDIQNLTVIDNGAKAPIAISNK